MDSKQLKKICKACIAHIQDGKANNDQWLSAKVDILSKWDAGYILTDGQISLIVKMFNNEVHRNPVRDITKKAKAKSTPTQAPTSKKNKQLKEELDDIPF